jgi:hypothetical protein
MHEIQCEMTEKVVGTLEVGTKRVPTNFRTFTRACVFKQLHNLYYILSYLLTFLEKTKIGSEVDKRGGSKSVVFFTLPIILLSKCIKAFYFRSGF